jgi:hypothetical protein
LVCAQVAVSPFLFVVYRFLPLRHQSAPRPKLRFEPGMAGRASASRLCTASSVSAPPPSEAHRPDIAAIFIARYARGALRTPCFAAHIFLHVARHPHTRSLHGTCQLAGGLEFGGGLDHRGAVRRGNGRRDGHGGGAPSTVTAAAKQKQATRARRYERQPPGATTGEEAVAVRTGASAGARCAALVDWPPSAAHASPVPSPACGSPAGCWPPRQAPALVRSRLPLPSPARASLCPHQLTPAPSVASSRQPTCPCQELTPDPRLRQRPTTTTGRTKWRNGPCSHAALEL